MLEDPYVDRLVWRALQRGCGAVIARAPRAAIDCNRSEDEVDPSVVEGLRRGRLSARARGGLGIVPARTQQHGYLWRRAITTKELDDRLCQAHRPFHDAVEAQLELLLDRFGCALLLDCHSMPPPAEGVAPVVFGDGRGRTGDRPPRGSRGRAQRSVRGGPHHRTPRAAQRTGSCAPDRDRPPLLSRRQAPAAWARLCPDRGIDRKHCGRARRSAHRAPLRHRRGVSRRGRRRPIARPASPRLAAAGAGSAPCPAASGARRCRASD